MKVSLSGEHLGERGTVDSVTRLVSQLRAYDVIQTAAKLLMVMESVTGGGVLEVQAQLAEELYASEASEHLLDLLRRGSGNKGIDVLFFPQQLLALEKVALAVGEAGPPSSFDERRDWPKFLLAAAQIVDVIYEFSRAPSPTAVREAGVVPRKPMAIHLLRNAAANRTTFYRAVAGRSYRMWHERRVPWPEGLETPEAYSQRVFEVSLERFLAIALAPAFARVNIKEPVPDEAPFDPERYFGRSEIPIEQVSRILPDLTYPDRLDAEVVHKEETYWSFTDIAARPYMRASDSTLIPASVGRAFERGTTGIFWMLHAHLRESGGDVEALTRHFGEIFEDYCFRLVESVASDHFRVETKQSYRRDGNEVESSDILVPALGRASPGRIFIECGALRPEQAVFRVASEDAFDSYLIRLLDKLRQLSRTIDDHARGLFTLRGDVGGVDDAYVPVLVVDEPLAWSPQLRDLLQAEVNGLGLFRGPARVTRPVVCEIGELEHLCHAIEEGSNGLDLLRGYLLGTDRELALEHYLYGELGTLGAPAFVSEGFGRLAEALIEALQLDDG